MEIMDPSIDVNYLESPNVESKSCAKFSVNESSDQDEGLDFRSIDSESSGVADESDGQSLSDFERDEETSNRFKKMTVLIWQRARDSSNCRGLSMSASSEDSCSFDRSCSTETEMFSCSDSEDNFVSACSSPRQNSSSGFSILSPKTDSFTSTDCSQL